MEEYTKNYLFAFQACVKHTFRLESLKIAWIVLSICRWFCWKRRALWHYDSSKKLLEIKSSIFFSCQRVWSRSETEKEIHISRAQFETDWTSSSRVRPPMKRVCFDSKKLQKLQYPTLGFATHYIREPVAVKKWIRLKIPTEPGQTVRQNLHLAISF